MPVTKEDLQKKLEEVTTRLGVLENERVRIDAEWAELLRKRENCLYVMAEFATQLDDQSEIDKSLMGSVTNSDYQGREINVAANILRDLPIADVADMVLDDNVWVTARSLFEILNARGKGCNYKAVRIALERNEHKRYEQRTDGPVIEWRKIVDRSKAHIPMAAKPPEPIQLIAKPGLSLTIPDRAEQVLRVRGHLHVKELFAAMRSHGWKGTGNDHNDMNTLLSTLSTRKQRFKNLGGNVWTVEGVLVAPNVHQASGTLFTN